MACRPPSRRSPTATSPRPITPASRARWRRRSPLPDRGQRQLDPRHRSLSLPRRREFGPGLHLGLRHARRTEHDLLGGKDRQRRQFLRRIAGRRRRSAERPVRRIAQRNGHRPLRQGSEVTGQLADNAGDPVAGRDALREDADSGGRTRRLPGRHREDRCQRQLRLQGASRP